MNLVISKCGNSFRIEIPQDIAIKAGIKEGMEVEIKVKDDKIAILPAKKKYELDELLQGVTPELIGGEYDWGQPVGREVW